MDDVERVRARLHEAGAFPDELAAADSLERLYRLAGDLGIRPEGVQVSLRAIAADAGVPLDVAVGFLHAAGIAVGDVDAPNWYSTDVEWMRATHAAAALFGEDAILALMRRAGGSMAQLVAAASSMFRANLGTSGDFEDPMQIVERNLGTRPLIDVLMSVLEHLYRYHSRLAFRDVSVAAGSFSEVREMTVGFVDLTASTEIGSRLSATELARAVNDFNTAAFDVATRHHTRIVKTIGDEAMIVGLHANAVASCALELVEYFDDHDVFTSARAGIATGDVLEQDGDCFGPVVNRAARLVEAAPDGQVTVDAATLAVLDNEFAAVALPTREHRGVGIVDWFTVTRP